MTTNSVSVYDGFRNSITKMQEEFRSVLPQQIPAERFIRTTLTAVQLNPELLQADRKSLLGSCMKAAQDGLLCDGREAALVTFNSKNRDTGEYCKMVQYMPMAYGITKKVLNSGEVSSLSAKVVHEKDDFGYWVDEHGEHFNHKPLLIAGRGKPVMVYAYAKMKDGACKFEAMTVEEVERVRQASRSKDRGPWADWWSEMAKKTVIRRLCKSLPQSAETGDVFRSDDETYDFSPAQVPIEDRMVSGLEASMPMKEVEGEEVVLGSLQQKLENTMPNEGENAGSSIPTAGRQ